MIFSDLIRKQCVIQNYTNLNPLYQVKIKIFVHKKLRHIEVEPCLAALVDWSPSSVCTSVPKSVHGTSFFNNATMFAVC